MIGRARTWIGLGLGACLCLALGACDTRGSAGSVTPGGSLGNDSELRPEGEFEGESIDELRLRLDHLVEDQKRQVQAAAKDASECEELCELSKAICEVKTKMCEIADERIGDDEYQNLCRRAKLRCQEASESCVRCVRHHQRSDEATEPATCGDD